MLLPNNPNDRPLLHVRLLLVLYVLRLVVDQQLIMLINRVTVNETQIRSAFRFSGEFLS